MSKPGYIMTYTGKKFCPVDPQPEDICIEDIAHGLALCNRFAGHTREPYSVAQHCCLVSVFCPHAKWGLMHDAAEAYIHDITKPLKCCLGVYQEVERNLERCIAERFGLEWPIPECVSYWDRVLLATEHRDLMNSELEYGFEPLTETITPWSWQEAEQEFLGTFEILFNEVFHF